MIGRAWLIARTDLAIMLRQRETILWVFLMPLIFFYFIGTVTAGFSTRGSAGKPDLLAISGAADGDVVYGEIVRRLRGQNYDVVRAPTAETFRQHARRLTITLPEGHRDVSSAVRAHSSVHFAFERDAEGTALTFDRVRIARAVYAVLGDLAVLSRRGEPVEPAAFQRLAATPRSLALDSSVAGRRVRAPVGFEQAVPGTMVMFTMLVLLTSGAIMLVLERRQGLLRRLASAPVSRGEVVLGKWIGRMALGLVQLAFAVLVGWVMFRISWGASLGMVGGVLFAWAGFNASLAVLLGSLARSEGQMAGIGVVTSMALGALGGCWWPIEVAPAWMQSLALFLPTGWTMDALHKLVNFGEPAVAAAPHALILIVAAIGVGWLGARVFRYS